MLVTQKQGYEVIASALRMLCEFFVNDLNAINQCSFWKHFFPKQGTMSLEIVKFIRICNVVTRAVVLHYRTKWVSLQFLVFIVWDCMLR